MTECADPLLVVEFKNHKERREMVRAELIHGRDLAAQKGMVFKRNNKKRIGAWQTSTRDLFGRVEGGGFADGFPGRSTRFFARCDPSISSGVGILGLHFEIRVI